LRKRGIHIGYSWERDHWEDRDVNGWTILGWILGRWDGVDWIDIAQNRDQWRALVNTIMNLRVPLNAGTLFSGCTIGSFSRRAQFRE
jgi:hypothetical protein